MTTPLDDYLMTKEAFFGRMARGMGRQFGGDAAEEFGGKLMSGAMGAVGGMALSGLGAAAAKVMDSITKKRDFKQMMATDPELSGLQQERPKFFNQAYSSLRNINPAFGKDPIVAGSYMRKMMANPDAAGLVVAQSVKAPQMGGPMKPMALGDSFSSPGDEQQQEMSHLGLQAARRKEQMAPMEMERAQLGLKGMRRTEREAGQREAGMAQQMRMFGK